MAIQGFPEPWLQPTGISGLHMGVTAVCWKIHLCLLVSINLDRLLILASIALGFFKLIFFFFRGKNLNPAAPNVSWQYSHCPATGQISDPRQLSHADAGLVGV